MGSATGTSRKEDTCSTLGKEATGTPADGVAAAVAAAAAFAAAAAGLKNRLRLCNLLRFCSWVSVGEAALPTLATTATMTRVKQVVHTTALASVDLRPISKSFPTLSDDVSITNPPLSILFQSLARNQRPTGLFIVNLLENGCEAVRARKFDAP